MVVCMERENCVKVYEELTALPNCPEVRLVMTANLEKDPTDWSAKGYYTTKAQRDALKKRMVDPDDPLLMVIVCDMWLTGTDIPCLHTLYLDKPMEGHNIIQAISRVNRVFSDKPHGLVVDYIGIGDQLREATAKYAQGGGKGAPAPGIEETARPLFMAELQTIREMLPSGHDYCAWPRMTHIEVEDLYGLVYGHLAGDTESRDGFLQAELRLSSAFLLVKHLDDCRAFADEVIFVQRVRKQISKTLPGHQPKRNVEQAVRDLVDDSIQSEGVVDIFKAAGLEKADISILDDKFLQTFRGQPQENLQVVLLTRLVEDEIQLRRRQNLVQAKSFKELLESTIQRYHNRLIDAASVVEVMIRIRQEYQAQEQRARDLNLAMDELAFYNAVAVSYSTIYAEQFLRDLIHDVVQTIKRNLHVDWTEPHREDVQAAVKVAVRHVLRRRNVHPEDFDSFLNYFIVQAQALYADWPLCEYAPAEVEAQPAQQVLDDLWQRMPPANG
jgi:type I restriction enzyme R subunit